MKNIKIGLIALVIVLSTFTSCKKLDLFPYNSIERGQSFKTILDARSWNLGLYSNFRGRLSGGFVTTADIQADQLNATLDYGNRNGNPHRWSTFLAEDGALSGPWSSYYSGITNINVAIKGFEEIVPTTPAQTADLNRYKGDNYLARAYYYYNLVIRFAKPYSVTTAATDLGVPIITEFDVTLQPKRATVKQVYDQILADINLARPLLTSFPGVQGSNFFNIDVLTALEARVKLEMRDWAGAYAAANTLITGGKYPLTTTAAAYRALWHVDGRQETIFQSFVSAPLELANTNGLYLGLITATGRFAPDFVPSQWVLDMFSNTDIRKATVFDPKTITIQGVNYTNVFCVNKYPGNPALFTTANTNYQHAPKAFNIGEMYLIAAESAFRLPNEANSRTALNALRIARGLAAISSTGPELFQDIKDERFRELAFEGFRLWDLKRWGDGFTRNTPQNAAFLTTGTGFNTLSISLSDPKFVWGIPTNDVTINPNIVQNPGW